jgi:hypothetical protein
MVEAPGTAPGSDRFITMTVYRHSRLPGTTNISAIGGFSKQETKKHASLKAKRA